MDNRSLEKTAMGLKESGKVHEKNIKEAIDSASIDMQTRINKAEREKKMPTEAVVMTYSETVVFTGSAADIKAIKRRWTGQYASKLPGDHSYNLKKYSRTVMVTPLPDDTHLWQTWELADVHMNENAKQRLHDNIKDNVSKIEQNRAK